MAVEAFVARGGVIVPEGSADVGILAYAPFGIGQFAQGKTLLGSGFAAGQAFGIFFFFERTTAAQQADDEALTVISDQETNQPYSDEEFLAFLDANASFVTAARQEAQLGLLIFFGLYGAGVAEAVLNPPSSSMGRRRAAWGSASQSLQKMKN